MTGIQAIVHKRKPSRKVSGGTVRTRRKPKIQSREVRSKGSQRTTQATPAFSGMSFSNEKSSK